MKRGKSVNQNQYRQMRPHDCLAVRSLSEFYAITSLLSSAPWFRSADQKYPGVIPAGLIQDLLQLTFGLSEW